MFTDSIAASLILLHIIFAIFIFFDSPAHFFPLDEVYPGLQSQVNPPSLLEQTELAPQSWVFELHSLISEMSF